MIEVQKIYIPNLISKFSQLKIAIGAVCVIYKYKTYIRKISALEHFCT